MCTPCQSCYSSSWLSSRPHTASTVCRVNGNLNLSRAIGDLKYKGNGTLPAKDQIITAQPDIIQARLLHTLTRLLSCKRAAGCAAA